MSSKILTPTDILKAQFNEYAFIVARILEQEAIKLAKDKRCDRCGRKEHLKLVPLHEKPQLAPTKIILYCSDCKFNKVLMSYETNKMMKFYTDELQKKAESLLPPEARKDKNEKVVKDKTIIDKLIK